MKIKLQKDDEGVYTGKFWVLEDFDEDLIPEGYVEIQKNLYGPANVLPCMYRSFIGNPNQGQVNMKCSHPDNNSVLPVLDCVGCDIRREITREMRFKNNQPNHFDKVKVECRHQKKVKTGCCTHTLCFCAGCPLRGQPVNNNICSDCDFREL